jgi:hypothetical protein
VDITLQEVADIVDGSKGNNYFSNQLEASLQPLFKKLKSVESSKETLSVSSLFNLDENKSKKFKDRYEKVLESFLSGYESMTKNMGISGVVNKTTGSKSPKPSEGVAKILTGAGIKPSTAKLAPPSEGVAKILASIQGKNDLTEEGVSNNVMDVNVVSLSDTVLEQLGSASESTKVVVQQPDKESNRNNDSDGSLIGKLLKGLSIALLGAGLGAGLIVAGISLAMKGLIDGGPTQGLFKLIGNVLISIGNIVFKKVTTIITNLMEPIGKLFSSKLGKGLTKKVGNILTTALGKLFKPLLNIGKNMGKGAKLLFKSIPYLGSIISLAFAVSRFKDGDMVGGLLELTSALLGLIPIPALALIPDVILMFRDFKMSKGEKSKSGGKFLQGFKNWITNLPFVKSITNVFSGIGLIFGAKSSEDIDKGIALLTGDNGLLGMLFPFASTMLSTIKYFLSGDFLMDVAMVGDKLGDFGSWIWGAISGVFKSAWTGIENAMHHTLMYIGKLGEVLLGSDFVQGILLKFKKGMLFMKLGFLSMFNVIIDLINKIPDYIENFTRDITAKANKFLPEAWQLEGVTFGDGRLNPLDTKTDIAKLNDINSKLSDIKGRDAERKLAAENEKAKRDDTKMIIAKLDELKNVTAGGAQGIMAAQASGAATVSKSIGNRPDGGVTNNNVFTDGNSNNLSDYKSRMFKEAY